MFFSEIDQELKIHGNNLYAYYIQSLLSSGHRGSFPGGKARPGHDADHSPPSNAEVKNA
jgi:hypothetical protein